MANGEFVESVEDLVARHLTVDAGMEIARATTGRAGRDGRVEDVIHRAILAALRIARELLAAPRAGDMTFDRAMKAVAEGRLVTRPGWGILRALVRWGDDGVSDFELDNLEGLPCGGGPPYCPTEEDLAATDWMVYRPPEPYIGLDFGN